MSGGACGLAGYVYQQDYVAFRFLGSEAKRLLIPDDITHCVASFKVEGRQTEGGPAWDVAWTLEDGTMHLRECKDTAITRDDRKAFYRRACQEIAKGTDPSKLCIGWVTDEGKQEGKILNHLTEMARIAIDAIEISGDKLPNGVNSAETALAEALYYLSYDDEQKMPQDTARALLARLAIDRFRAEELAESIEWMAPSIFQSGTGTTIRQLIQGNVTTTIQRDGFAEYTRQRFLEELKHCQLTLEMEGSLRDILTYHSTPTVASSIPGITWSCRPERPKQLWALSERLGEWNEQCSCVLVGRTGVGKTTSSLQLHASQASHMNKHHVLRVEAGDVDTDVVTLLPRLCSMLCGVSATWIGIDGLDRIVPAMQHTWRQTLKRLLSLPNLTVVITARREVVAAHDWMQELLSVLPEIPLDDLSEEQVVAEFQAVGLPPPRNQSLLNCLKNAFLLSIYAKTVSDDDVSLTYQGEATAFDVIEAYWNRRVTTESQGFRVSGNAAESAVAKRAAVGYLSDRTLAGNLVIERPNDNTVVANGIETLCREGVLTNRSTTTVAWYHSWLGEYAAIERLIGMLENPNVDMVAHAVCGISIDHAARNAAVGGCKWIIAHRDLGYIEDYLSALYNGNSGLAREALVVLLEDSPRHLQLSRLPPRLLIEAISLAREMKARQWNDQIVSIPDSLFAGSDGPELNLAIFQYESEMMNHE